MDSKGHFPKLGDYSFQNPRIILYHALFPYRPLKWNTHDSWDTFHFVERYDIQVTGRKVLWDLYDLGPGEGFL